MSRTKAASRSRRMAWFAVGGIAALIYSAAPPGYIGSDSSLVFPTAVSIVHGRDLSLDEFRSSRLSAHYAWWQTDRGAFSQFPWTPALALVPVVVAIDIRAAVGGGPDAEDMILVSGDSVYSTVNRYERIGAVAIAALCVVLLGLVIEQGLRARGNARASRVAAACSFAIALGSSLWSVVAKAMWQHGPSIALASVAVLLAGGLRVDESRRRSTVIQVAAIGAAMGAACTVRPTNFLPTAAMALWVWWRGRLLVTWYVTGVGVILLPWALVGLMSFGRALPPYFRAGRLGMHDNILNALAANLVSPSRGLLVMSPIVIMSFIGVWIVARRREFNGLHVICGAAAFSVYLATSAYPHWWGGDGFGQRLLSETYPYLAVLAVPAIDAATRPLAAARLRLLRVVSMGALVGISWLVHWQGAHLRAATCWTRLPRNVTGDDSRFWSLSDSQALRGLRVMLTEGSYEAAADQQCPPGGP